MLPLTLCVSFSGAHRLSREQIDEGVIHRELLNSSYPTKAEFMNCYIIYSK